MPCATTIWTFYQKRSRMAFETYRTLVYLRVTDNGRILEIFREKKQQHLNNDHFKRACK